MLVSTAVVMYMDEKRARLRATTIEGYESALRRHVLPRWGSVDIERIDPDDVQRWVDGFELAGAAEKAYKTLRQVVRWCMRRLRLRIADPTVGVELPRKAPYRPRVLSARQERDTLRGIVGAPFEAVVLCAATLGLRRCEACGLDWSDVDFRSGRVHVRRGLHVVGGREVVTPPKTDRSDRVLSLPAFALRRLRKIAAGRRRGRMCAMSPDQVARALKRWCRARHLPWVPMQCLRHSWATISIGHGTPLADVALCLGHSTQQTCFEHYLVRTSDICRRAAKSYAAAVLGS